MPKQGGKEGEREGEGRRGKGRGREKEVGRGGMRNIHREAYTVFV